jgi:superfamily I DNA/RNA helicase
MFGLIGQLLETEGIPYTQIGRPPYSGEIQAGTVTISTIHSAKGYEYEVVFLFGVDNLPYKRSSTEDQIEEERHLAYVAATRSKDQLFIMYTKSGELIKNLSNCDPNSLNRWVYPDDYPLNEA